MSEQQKEYILEVSEEDYQKGLDKGWTEDDMLPVGKHTFRRVPPERRAKKEDLLPSNIKVEFQMKLDLDVLKYFQEHVESEEIEALQVLLNEKLRVVMEEELKLKKVNLAEDYLDGMNEVITDIKKGLIKR
jgi:ribosomal protein RSM22 (predicted rRNA methylase)